MTRIWKYSRTAIFCISDDDRIVGLADARIDSKDFFERI